jgi:hypothetical protein
VRVAVAQQVGRGIDWQGHGRRALLALRFTLLHNEAAADGVVSLYVGAAGVQGCRERQAVGVERQAGVGVEDDVLRRPELDGSRPAQAKPLRRHDRLDLRVELGHVAGDRVLTREAQQHGEVCAVPAPGLGQRAEQVGADAQDPVKDVEVAAAREEALRRPPRAERVRAGRPDADFEDVEDADRFHARGPHRRGRPLR